MAAGTVATSAESVPHHDCGRIHPSWHAIGLWISVRGNESRFHYVGRYWGLARLRWRNAYPCRALYEACGLSPVGDDGRRFLRRCGSEKPYVVDAERRRIGGLLLFCVFVYIRGGGRCPQP